MSAFFGPILKITKNRSKFSRFFRFGPKFGLFFGIYYIRPRFFQTDEIHWLKHSIISKVPLRFILSVFLRIFFHFFGEFEFPAFLFFENLRRWFTRPKIAPPNTREIMVLMGICIYWVSLYIYIYNSIVFSRVYIYIYILLCFYKRIQKMLTLKISIV